MQAPRRRPRVAERRAPIELAAVEGLRFEVQVLSAAEAPLYRITSKEDEGLSLRNIGAARERPGRLRGGEERLGRHRQGGPPPYNAEKPYKLQVSQEEAGANAELEPNDEPSKATPLPSDGYREGFLSPKSDVDYYVLQADAPSLAKLQLSGVERLDLDALGGEAGRRGHAEEMLLKANDGAVKEPESLNNVLCCERECYFKVEGALRKVDGKWVRDYENPSSPYRLTVSVVPDNGTEEREPNNADATATPIAIGRPMRGTIHPKKDVDYYKLDLSGRPVKTPLKATVTGILKVDIGLYLHRVDADGQAVAGADGRPGEGRGARGDPLLRRARRLRARGPRLRRIGRRTSRTRTSSPSKKGSSADAR